MWSKSCNFSVWYDRRQNVGALVTVILELDVRAGISAVCTCQSAHGYFFVNHVVNRDHRRLVCYFGSHRSQFRSWSQSRYVGNKQNDRFPDVLARNKNQNNPSKLRNYRYSLTILFTRLKNKSPTHSRGSLFVVIFYFLKHFCTIGIHYKSCASTRFKI